MELQIQTGKKVYTLKDENGNELGKISFNPGDPNFMARVKGFRNYLESKDTQIKEIDGLIKDGKVEAAVDVMFELDKELKERIDEIFDCKVSEIVFGNTSCLSRMENGESFVESFLGSILPELKKGMTGKVEHYTKGYLNDRKPSHKSKRKRH